MARKSCLVADMTPEQYERRKAQRLAYNHRVKELNPEQYAKWLTAATESSTPEKRKAQYSKHREKRISESAEYRKTHREEFNRKARDYSKKKKEEDEKGFLESKRISVTQWRRSSKGLEWHRKNKGRKNEQTRARQARLKQALPPWADRNKIRSLYDEAQDISLKTGIRHEVDHIIPLRGRNVSGLHIFENLQIIPMIANRKKGNRR